MSTLLGMYFRCSCRKKYVNIRENSGLMSRVFPADEYYSACTLGVRIASNM